MYNNVEKSKAMSVFDLIMRLAIEIPIDIYRSDELYTDVSVINYLEAISLDAYRTLDLQRDKLGPQITKREFMQIVDPKVWLSTSAIRVNISPERATIN